MSKLEFHVSDRAGALLFASACVLALSNPAPLFAGLVGPLTSFVNGTVADADAVNANFTALVNAVDDNHNRIAALEGASAPGGFAPSANCYTIKQEDPTATSGTYWIDPDQGNPYNAFQAYCDMDSHGGGWTLVLSAGLGRDLTGGDLTGSHGTPTAGQPANGALAKFSDARINQIKSSSGSDIGYWITTPGDGDGLHGAEIFHRADCTFQMHQNSSALKASTCHQSTTDYADTPVWVGGGHWWDNSTSYLWAFGYSNEGDHGTGNTCYPNGRGLGAHSGVHAPFHRGWCANAAWGQVWVR
jgi:hypothetical protein